jgi:hypothetical protein
MSRCEAEAVEKYRLLRTEKPVCRKAKDMRQTGKTVFKLFFLSEVYILK